MVTQYVTVTSHVSRLSLQDNKLNFAWHHTHVSTHYKDSNIDLWMIWHQEVARVETLLWLAWFLLKISPAVITSAGVECPASPGCWWFQDHTMCKSKYYSAHEEISNSLQFRLYCLHRGPRNWPVATCSHPWTPCRRRPRPAAVAVSTVTNVRRRCRDF